MNIIIGIIIGLIISTLIFSILAFFRAGIEKRVKIIETTLGQAGPKQTGAVFIPDEDIDLRRQKIIEKNRKAGKDTPFSELRDI